MVNKPAPSGEYAVGTFTHTIHTNRDEVLNPGTKRSVPVRVYYPVLKASVEGMSKIKYMSRDMANALKKSMHAPINYDKSDAAGDNFSDCYENAPKIEGMKFPLIMFNHGLASYREANSFLCLDLASHGYVVISVGHPYDASLTELDDGTKIGLHKDTMKRQYEPFLPGAISVLKLTKSKGSNRELADRFDVIQNKYCKYVQSRVDEWEKDTLSAVDYAKENLSDIIDFSNGIGATGHSLGGATAYMLCLDHEEFVCGLNLDGALFGNNKGKILRKPFAQISCKTNHKAETRPYIDHTRPVYSALFQKMQHIAFSDMKHMIPIKAIVGGLDADLAHEYVCKIHLELFDSYLKKTKDHPELKSCDMVTIKEYQPDVKV
jgi:dienelactone hydrolase